MSTSLTARDIDPADMSRLSREAPDVAVSMEGHVRRMIDEKRPMSQCRPKPSEAFARYFGERQGVELPLPARCAYRRLSFAEDDDG